MADTAFQTMYRQEFIAGFETGQSPLRLSVTTESNINGNQAVFLVADSGDATAVTRGTDGRIPGRPDNNTQLTCTLTEWHDVVEKTGFNVFASQGNQRRIMQMTTNKVLNRKINADIIAQLDTATNNTGGAATASVAMVADAHAILGYNSVPTEDMDNMFGLVSPGWWKYMMQTKEFSSGEYVDVKTFSGAVKKMWRWFGVNWIMYPLVTGANTSSEKLYIWHRDAIGHAIDMERLAAPVGYDERHDFSFARASGYFGSKLLQQDGVVQMLHAAA